MTTKIIALVFCLLGFFTLLLGTWLKITHLSFGPFDGNITLVSGLIFEVIGTLFLIPFILKKLRT